MTNFTINFVYPWVLLLLIPAFALAFWTYFRTQKKYRRNRNRITSLVLHILVMTLSIFALSGISFAYDEVNTENELIILVDASFSNVRNENEKDEFVREVVENSASTNKVGVVTFGYDQVYAAPLSNDIDAVYDNYKTARKPDTTATDIASALAYARDLFKHPASAKIVLLSDGVETDGDALNMIKSVSASGVRVDTVHFPNVYDAREVQITGVKLPDYNIALETEFDIILSIRSRATAAATVTLADNGKEAFAQSITVGLGEQQYTFKHEFSERGLHSLRFTLTAEQGKDTLTQNNVYDAYYYIENFEDLLVIARDPAEAEAFRTLMSEQYDTEVVGINDAENLPTTLDKLREYDEVVLFNISNADMPYGFIDVLYAYVHELGGGLFTVGGDRMDYATGKPVPNAYNRNDMYEDGKPTLYQDMLPVQVIDYTPPVGVVIIVDCSGSMQSTLEDAKQGAISALYSFSDRDWCGVVALSDEDNVKQHLLPLTRQAAIIDSIRSLTTGGGTNFSKSIEYAGNALRNLTGVEKRHVILITDGMPGDSFEKYSAAIDNNYNGNPERRVTFSMVVVGSSPSNEDQLKDACGENHGHGVYYRVGESGNSSISDVLRKDLQAPTIREYNPEPFTPLIRNYTSVVNGIDQKDMPMLGGFYGTKAKTGSGVEVVLVGDYAPVYVQWTYGKGRVGSFMSELSGLSGSWSAEWLASDVGKRFLSNTVNALFPSQSIKYSDLDAGLTADNYTTYVNVYTSVADDEKIELTVTGPPGETGSGDVYKTTRTKAEGYSRIPFENVREGVYEISVKKLDANGNTLSEYRTFKAFSYSSEYDMFVNNDDTVTLMTEIAANGKGTVVTQPMEIFDGFVEIEHFEIDPRLVLMITALVLFLLDIAVRKFKWKWIHEIVRERKNKKRDAGGAKS